ncbi:hypothetical protein PI23P_08635 [Polaribacter irgensii 23-P]|uniref:Glycosyltransferase 2-like domain-containing protein n=1 Tax=Polaribacter irgensii 23-P TaxID=313594 RepID=A4BZT6_9FLAO|nr:hypothetical protein [Polaribacter irgensii]EAR12679.1 hypothetical protein PI23P_08635 [Polaribacter irgensii 23-P]
MNVKIIKRKFDDFSSQKNFAIDQVSHEWIYILNADERVTPAVVKEIIAAVKILKVLLVFTFGELFIFAKKSKLLWISKR